MQKHIYRLWVKAFQLGFVGCRFPQPLHGALKMSRKGWPPTHRQKTFHSDVLEVFDAAQRHRQGHHQSRSQLCRPSWSGRYSLSWWNRRLGNISAAKCPDPHHSKIPKVEQCKEGHTRQMPTGMSPLWLSDVLVRHCLPERPFLKVSRERVGKQKRKKGRTEKEGKHPYIDRYQYRF